MSGRSRRLWRVLVCIVALVYVSDIALYGTVFGFNEAVRMTKGSFGLAFWRRGPLSAFALYRTQALPEFLTASVLPTRETGLTVGKTETKNAEPDSQSVDETGVSPEALLGEWSGVEGPTFCLYNSVGKDFDNPPSWMDSCELEVPAAFCNFLFDAPNHVADPGAAELFLVPVLETTVLSNIVALRQDRYFMRFRGSDFVFLCFTSDCQATEAAVLNALGRDVRAVWVDRGGDSHWPCANRRITVESTDSSSISDWETEGRLWERVLTYGRKLIDGRARWSCKFRAKWGLNTPDISDFRTIAASSSRSIRDEVAYCETGDISNSDALSLMRRLSDTDTAATVSLQNLTPKTSYSDEEEMVSVFDSPLWVKGMMVRDPVARVLSEYQSRIEQRQEYDRVPGGWPVGSDPPSLKQFIERIHAAKVKSQLDLVDPHFRPQSALCGARSLPYDFIGLYEHRQVDFYNFLASLKLEDSAWSSSGGPSLLGEHDGIAIQDGPEVVAHAGGRDVLQGYLTRELVEELFEVYSEDFDRFGFSKDVSKYLVKPE